MELQYRKTCRTQITKLINASEDLLKNEAISVEDLTIMLDRVNVAHVNLKEANEKVLPHLKQDKLEEEFEYVLDYDDRVAVATSRLRQRLARLAAEDQRGRGTSSEGVDERRTPVQSHNQVSGSVETTINSVRLPKLNLKTFNGDLHDFIPFWEQFKSAVHENKTLDSAGKFNYLKSVLTGKALDTINGLSPSEACYKDAIEMLQDEYGNKERIVDSYIQQLVSLREVKGKSDVAGLRKLYNTTSAVTRSLTALGISSERYSLIVKTILIKSLPFQLRVEFNKLAELESDSEDLDSQGSGSSSEKCDKQIKSLLKFIKREVDSVECAQAVSGTTNTSSGVSKEERKHKNNYPKNPRTVSGLFTGATENKCVFCDSNTHATVKCRNKNFTIEQKRQILKRNSRCYKCTKPNHMARDCRNVNLECTNCKGKHSTVMCDPNYKKRLNENKNDNKGSNGGEGSEQTSSLITNGCFNEVLLQTACAYISTANDLNKNDTLIRIVLDGGSQLTFVKECVSKKLNLNVVGTHRLSIIPFGSNQKGPSKCCNKVELFLKSQHTKQYVKLNAIEVPEICFDALSTPPTNIRKLNNYELADAKSAGKEPIKGISMLIGADNYWKIVTGETEKITSDLMAINTMLGWTLHGPTPVDSYSVNLNIATVLHASFEEENFDITSFWNLETIGIESPNNVSGKLSETFTKQFCKENIKKQDNRYEVVLPWKYENVRLNDNHDQALARVKGLTKNLVRNSKLLEYDEAVRNYLNTGCAEKAPYVQTEGKTYFMPHRPVYREDKDTTKVRVVFDASAHPPGFASLNENLFSGENLIPEVIKILLNFRIGQIGLCADIEKAFLQISITERDRDSHSFLWYSEKISDETKLPDIVNYRMKRVTFGVTTSPFLLTATINKHLSDQPMEFDATSKILRKSFYVDDLVLATDSVDEALKIYNEAVQIMSSAQMNLRKWVSNSDHLRNVFREEQTANISPCPKILGILWYTDQDELSVNLESIVSYAGQEKIITKRNILKTISRIYDPLGFLGPFIITSKILMQTIWKENLEWDSILPDNLQSEWISWVSDIKSLNEFSLPRCILENSQMPVQLHVFADASPRAYGATAFIRTCENDVYRSNLFMSKSRVAPIKVNGENELSLPRLELTAAVCAARLQNYIISSTRLIIENVYLWTDSKITFQWIKGKPERWKPYVANRVREIQAITKQCKWRHCSGQENPADLVTRGIKPSKLITSNLWRNGPEWLCESEDNWPQEEVIEDDENFVLNVRACEEKIEPLFDVNKYSSLEKILRVTSYILRFVNNARTKNKKLSGNLQVKEMKMAETYWLKHIQKNHFPEEIQALKRSIPLNKNSAILTLSPFQDKDGLMRLGGRLQESELSYETQHPIILPKSNPWVTKLILKSHEKLHHGGVNMTLAELRKDYWIIKGRQKIKSTIARCVVCKKFRGKPGTTEFAPLPQTRILESRAFENIGTDFAGPLYITENGKSKKVYIMLLTCAVTRAIHLELVPDITTESCLRGLRRFMARRGVPSTIYSDNAKTFKRASLEIEELNSILRNDYVQSFALKRRVQWKFIVERAAWWGGFWERLVRTVKDSLKLSIGKALLNFDELQTILTEIEATINARPLTYIDNDPNNPLILSPANFLTGDANSNLTKEIPLNEINRNALLDKWKLREMTLRKFWKRWSSDYLQQLRTAHHLNPKKSTLFKIGNVALLHDQHTPRILWKLVRVTNLFHGRDGKVRACEVRLPSGKIFRRPIQLLYPLELDNEEEVLRTPGPEDVENSK